MIEEKFEKKQEKVLYNIARALKIVSVEELVELTGNSLTDKQVRTALVSLQRRKLVKKEIDSYILNISQIFRIKKIIGNHWEQNWEKSWEDTWKNAVKD